MSPQSTDLRAFGVETTSFVVDFRKEIELSSTSTKYPRTISNRCRIDKSFLTGRAGRHRDQFRALPRRAGVPPAATWCHLLPSLVNRPYSYSSGISTTSVMRITNSISSRSVLTSNPHRSWEVLRTGLVLPQATSISPADESSIDGRLCAPPPCRAIPFRAVPCRAVPDVCPARPAGLRVLTRR